MKPIDKNTQVLSHMHDYCMMVNQTIARFGDSFEDFISDNDFKNSVSMSLLQIGELVPRLSDEFIAATSSKIPWRNMKNMRNLFAHDYDSMNVEIIWLTAREDIPQLMKFCKPYKDEYEQACTELDDIDPDEAFSGGFTQSM